MLCSISIWSSFYAYLTDQTLYQFPDNLSNAISFCSLNSKEYTDWYKIEQFSTTDYFNKDIEKITCSSNFSSMSRKDAKNMDYLVAVQNDCKNLYFQKVTKKYLSSKSFLSIGARCTFNEDSLQLTINPVPDALYVKDQDILYFHDISKISVMFKGIEKLNRLATTRETKEFLSEKFIKLGPDYNVDKVGVNNRKRIIKASEELASFSDLKKRLIFTDIDTKCSELEFENGQFKVNSEKHLELLLFGILQRLYITPDGEERRVASSVKSI